MSAANGTWLVAAAAAVAVGCPTGDGARRAERPRTPVPIAPKNGRATGCPHAADGRAARPRFAWSWVDRARRAVRYDLQVDDDCEPGRMQTCSFPSPEIDARGLVAAQFEPDAPLPIADRPPVGRRYYWRVRACAGGVCSAWSRVRYADVARCAGDFDGDGYSDVAVGAPLVDAGGVDRGSAFVYYGAAGGIRRDRVTRIDDPARGDGSVFGVAVAVAGDVDADGFADLIVGAAGTREHRGFAYVFRGGPDGVAHVPSATIRDPDGQLGDWFGAAVAGAGDVDGDGYADVLVGASGTDRDGIDWGAAHLLYGSAEGIVNSRRLRIVAPQPTDYDHFGYALAPAGDVNGDGYADVAIGSPGIDLAGMYTGTDRGAVYVFHGAPDGLSQVPAARLEAPVPLDYDRFGFAIAGAGDVDADGFDDVLVGAPGIDSPHPDGGVAYLFVGSAGGAIATPRAVLEDPRIEVFDRFGTSVAGAGDVDADGFDDVVIGASAPDRGRGLVFRGGPEGIDPIPSAVLRDPLGPGYNHFADAVAGAGDVDADGFDDVIIGASGSDNGGVYRGSVVLYPGTRNGVDPHRRLRLDDPDRGEHDHFGHVVAGR
ncbi:MAG: hypothetical protein D6689_13335 [Deltaproteobacteria bacterium]|nr:MAG: hypothetical protein D6689_13335 [Deltaproteobacteria bacterium]